MQSVRGNIFVLLIALIIWVPTNCGSSPRTKKDDENKKVTEGVAPLNPYFPLSTGNEWEYINEAPREETTIYKTAVTSFKTDGKNRIAEFSSFPFFSKEEKPVTLRMKEDGAVYLVGKDSKENLLIPSVDNLKNGFVWEFGEWRAAVVSTNDTVKTEYGTFENCLYLNFSIYFTFSAELWLAKDAGIVKWGYNRTNPPTLKPEYYVLTKLNIAK